MKANKKSQNDDGVANVVSTIMIIAIVVPLMTIMLLSFANMSMKQIEMMETTSAILGDSLIHLQENLGYKLHTGYGTLYNLTYTFKDKNNVSIKVPFCLIGHKHEIPDEGGMYNGCYNYSGYYPVENLSAGLKSKDISDRTHIKFKVDEMDTYFKFIIPDVYAVWKNVSGSDVNYEVVFVTSNETLAIEKSIEYDNPNNYTTVPMYMVNVLEIEKRI